MKEGYVGSTSEVRDAAKTKRSDCNLRCCFCLLRLVCPPYLSCSIFYYYSAAHCLKKLMEDAVEPTSTERGLCPESVLSREKKLTNVHRTIPVFPKIHTEQGPSLSVSSHQRPSSRSQPELHAGGSYSVTLTWLGWVGLSSHGTDCVAPSTKPHALVAHIMRN